MSAGPETILDKIAARTRSDLDDRSHRIPLGLLETAAAEQLPAISLSGALRSGNIGLIAEFKRASPSKGTILEDADPAEIAGDYLAAGASAISVLTDLPFFSGSLEDLRFIATLAHRHEPARPVLRKDFLLDRYQVVEARAAGADAVLLIVALLQGEDLRAMLGHVAEFGMQALVEVHDEQELEEALTAGATIIGINNRDLRTFTVDLATTERLAPRISQNLTIVAESGIHSADDVRRLQAAGAHAVLVGESLMLADDRQAAVRELML